MGLSLRWRSLLSDPDLLPLLCLRCWSRLLLSSSRLLLFLSSSSELGSSLGPSSGSPAPSLLGLLSSSLLLSSLLLRWPPWRLSLLGLRSWRRRSSLESSLLELDLLGGRLLSSLEPDLCGVLRRVDR